MCENNEYIVAKDGVVPQVSSNQQSRHPACELIGMHIAVNGPHSLPSVCSNQPLCVLSLSECLILAGGSPMRLTSATAPPVPLRNILDSENSRSVLLLFPIRKPPGLLTSSAPEGPLTGTFSSRLFLSLPSSLSKACEFQRSPNQLCGFSADPVLAGG